MERRAGASGKVLRRRLDGVGYSGVRLIWTVSGDGRAAVEEDARGMAVALGTRGTVEKMTQSSGGSEIHGTMPWSHGQNGMTWDDASEILREEGLLR